MMAAQIGDVPELEVDVVPFFEEGFVMVPGVLGAAAVASFVQQLEDELAREPSSGDAGGGDLLYDRTDLGRVSLRDRRTWPTGKKRRVVECAPFPPQPPASAHWDALRDSPVLVQALNSIVGTGCWEMPFNGESTEPHPGWNVGHPPRHFYFPIVFPEHEYPTKAKASVPAVTRGEPQDDTLELSLRKIELHSWRDELAQGAFTSESIDAPSRWQPVSRRRFRGKGWYLCILYTAQILQPRLIISAVLYMLVFLHHALYLAILVLVYQHAHTSKGTMRCLV